MNSMQRCYARRHLRGCALSVYEFALAVTTGRGGEFFASNAVICDATGYAVEAVISAKKHLLAQGWLKKIEDYKARARNGGHFRPNRYQVVEHEAWASEHVGHCKPRLRSLPLRQDAETGETLFPVTAKAEFPVTAKCRNKVREESSERNQEEGAEAPAIDISQGPWGCLGFAEPIGSESFREHWETVFRNVLAGDEICKARGRGPNLQELVGEADLSVGGRLFDGSDVPKDFLCATIKLNQSLPTSLRVEVEYISEALAFAN
jgi:hypothetical protein